MKRKLLISVLVFAFLLSAMLCFSACNKNLVRETKEINGDINDITIITDTADVSVLASSGEFYVECARDKKLELSVRVSDGKAIIELIDDRPWPANWFTADNQKVTVYLPFGDYGTLDIETHTGDVELNSLNLVSLMVTSHTGDIEASNINVSTTAMIATDTGDTELYDSTLTHLNAKATTGDISVSRVEADSVQIEVTTGDIEVEDLNCQTDIQIKATTGNIEVEDLNCQTDVQIKATTGDIEMRNVFTANNLRINTTTGNVNFRSIDGAEVYINATTGDVRGSFASDKIIFAETTTGKVNVPKLTTGGRCEITTTTGDVNVTIN